MSACSLADRMAHARLTVHPIQAHVAGGAQGLVINGNVSTVPRGAAAHPHAFS